MQIRPLSCLVVSAVVLLAGCGVGGGGSDASPGSTGKGSPAPTGALSAKAVLAGLRGSIALIDTPIASGSAILVEGGYLVTNAHVVDPFGVADVTFDGEETLRDVEVVGVDLDADIAVLGPIEGDHPVQSLQDPSGLEQGSGLFLVGFPGDQEEPQVTIVGGILSRRRDVKEWGFHFLQSDAKIAPGQSGGAMVDDQGRVIAITGLADDDGYTLAFSGADAAQAVESIIAGDGSDWDPAPQRATDEDATFHVDGIDDYRLLYYPAAEEDRTVTVHVDGPAPIVELDDAALYPLELNEAAHDLGSITGDPGAEEGIPEPTEPDADGGLSFPIDAGYPAVLFVGTDDDAPATISVTSSLPFAVAAGDPEPTAIQPGDDEVRGTLGYFDTQRVFTLDLEAGEDIDIRASTPSGDVAYTLVAPGDTFSGSKKVDDGGGGLFGTDAEGSATVDEAGTYRLYVYQVEGVATGFRLSVEAG